MRPIGDLIDHHDVVDLLVAEQRVDARPASSVGLPLCLQQRRIQHVLHQRRLARAATRR